MEFLNQIAQRIDDHRPDYRMVAVDGIAAAGKIEIVIPLLVQEVVDRVVNGPESRGDALEIAFTRMVEDQIEDNLDACPVKTADHGFELVDRLIGPGSQPRSQGKKRQRVVAPVVQQRLTGLRFKKFVVGLVPFGDRQQLHRSYSQFLQVADFLCDGSKGTRCGNI